MSVLGVCQALVHHCLVGEDELWVGHNRNSLSSSFAVLFHHAPKATCRFGRSEE